MDLDEKYRTYSTVLYTVDVTGGGQEIRITDSTREHA